MHHNHVLQKMQHGNKKKAKKKNYPDELFVCGVMSMSHHVMQTLHGGGHSISYETVPQKFNFHARCAFILTHQHNCQRA